MFPTDESLSELIRNVTVTLLPQRNRPNTVLVNISWTFLSDPSKVNFSIAIMLEDDAGGLLVYKDDVPGTYVVVELLDSTVYKVVVSIVDVTLRYTCTCRTYLLSHPVLDDQCLELFVWFDFFSMSVYPTCVSVCVSR